MRRAFTLIELLTVIAITAVLMTLVVVPVFQSFNLTRAAQAFGEAQDKGRLLVERISREIGTSANVRDVSGTVVTTLNGNANTVVPRSSVVATIPDGSGGIVETYLPYAKVDLVKPAAGEIELDGSGNPVYRDPDTGKIDPTLQGPKGQVVLPVAQGTTLVRYVVGLRDPFSEYNAPYDGILQARNAQRDNLYVLWRFDVVPFEYVADGTDPNQLRAVPNSAYFDVDPATTVASDPQSGRPLYDDPRFLIPNRDGSGNIITTDAKADRIRNWLRRGVLQTEVSRYDMIRPLFDRRSRQPLVVAGVPQVIPLIQFRPTRISSDPARGEMAVRLGDEADNAEIIGPDVFRSNYGMWSNVLIRTWPQGWISGNPARNEYLVGVEGATGSTFAIIGHDPDLGDESVLPQEKSLFDVTAYEKATVYGRYPFVEAVMAAEQNNAARGVGSWLADSRMREIFTPYSFNAGKGSLLSSFGIDEVGDPSIAPPLSNPRNLPTVLINPPTARHPNPPYSVGNDPDTIGNFYDAEFQSINERMNKVWADHPELRPDVHRFIDLRVTPTGDGWNSPLHPDPSLGFPKARIVPGSEEVWGPDQLIGPNYGRLVRYTRTTREPGPNQYRINYVDQPEPDYAALGYPSPPAIYDPTNFVSAIIQPRYKAGYLQLNSDPNVPLPAYMEDGTANPPPAYVRVYYRFQFTGKQQGRSSSDVFAVDYDSRELMSVLLTIRNYPQSNIPNPQTVTLKATAKVRNFIR